MNNEFEQKFNINANVFFVLTVFEGAPFQSDHINNIPKLNLIKRGKEDFLQQMVTRLEFFRKSRLVVI